MDLPKVIIQENYSDFVDGKEVEATVASSGDSVHKGMRVMGYHNSIATKTTVAVPREKQAHYIGIEGVITEVSETAADSARPQRVKVVKL